MPGLIKMKRFLVTSLISTLVPLSALDAKPMSFRIATHYGTNGESWIVADGAFDTGTAERFRAFLQEKKISQGWRMDVYLNSPGGNLEEGLELGRIIRQYKLGTRVARSEPISSDSCTPGGYCPEQESSGYCASACSYAFLGGVWRVADDRSIGVHQYYYKDDLKNGGEKKYTGADLSREQSTVGRLAEYVLLMGADARFLIKASATTPQDELYRFSADELRQYNITWMDTDYGKWFLEPYKDGLIAAVKTLNGLRTVTVFCRSDRRLRLLLTTESIPGFSAEQMATSVNVFGQEIEDYVATTRNERYQFEFKLPANPKFEYRSSGISALGPNRLFLDQRIPFEGFLPMSRLVQRNCI